MARRCLEHRLGGSGRWGRGRSNRTRLLACRDDGGIFTYGSAHFHGSMGAAPVEPAGVLDGCQQSGIGYWLVARDGGIFCFGDAHFYGSTGAIT